MLHQDISPAKTKKLRNTEFTSAIKCTILYKINHSTFFCFSSSLILSYFISNDILFLDKHCFSGAMQWAKKGYDHHDLSARNFCI